MLQEHKLNSQVEFVFLQQFFVLADSSLMLHGKVSRLNVSQIT